MDDNQTTKSIWNKTQDELTVGDAVKAQIVILAAFAAGTVAVCAGVTAASNAKAKFQTLRANRKANKTDKTEE